MSFGRVLRLRWHVLLAVAIRLLLFWAYLGKLVFPARAIPVTLWRAIRTYRDGTTRDGDPRHQIVAALQLYSAFLAKPGGTDMVSTLVLGVVTLIGASVWWAVAAPLLTLVVIFLVAPLVALLVLTYATWFATMLDYLSTKLVLATNEPLHQLLLECVDAARLRSRERPLFVTLASLREVTRTTMPTPGMADSALPSPSKARPPSWWQKTVTDDKIDADYGHQHGPAAPYPVTTVETVEYVPSHFDVRTTDPALVHELILQSAGLPEIFLRASSTETRLSMEASWTTSPWPLSFKSWITRRS